MIQFFKNMKFRTKLLLICMMISLIPTVFLGIFSYHQLRALLTEREQTALHDSIVQERLNISSELGSYETITNCIIWDKNLISMLNQTYDQNSKMFLAYQDTIEPLFKTLRGVFPSIDNMTLYTDLAIYPRQGFLQPISVLEDSSWYSDAAKSSRPLWVAYPTEHDLSVVRRFIDAPSDISAFVLIQPDRDKLFSSLTTLLSSSYGVIITDASGQLIWQFHTDDFPDDAVFLEQSASEYLSYFENHSYISESTADQNTGWIYYIFRPEQIVLEPAREMLSIVLSIIFLCLFFVLLVSFWLSHALVRPLEDLNNSIIQIAAGNYDITLTPHSTDEIGTLMKNCSIMVSEINSLINEKLKAKITRQKLEFRALQAQINPHFLYNTLSLINSQSILAGHPEIGLPARYLSTFYLTSLNKGKDLILVNDELKNVKSYINIQLLMHNSSFDVDYEIDNDILSCTMPNLMLQPLAENAIAHGIDTLPPDRRGRLSVTAKSCGENLIFQVADNGNGIPEEKLATILTERSSGYGAENVHARARLLYGSEYGLSYHSEIGFGTVVTLTLPKLAETQDS